MSQGTTPSSDPLAVFLSGKRRHPRQAVTLAVELVGRMSRIPGQAVDVSEGGAMIGVRCEDLEAVGSSEFLEVVHGEFGDGFDVHFLGAKIAVEAEVVRLTGDEEVMFFGCQFVEPLTATQQEQLELSAAPSDADGSMGAKEFSAAPFEPLPLEPRSELPPCLLIFGNRPALHGPQYVAQVTGLGDCAWSARIQGANPAEVSAILGSRVFFVRFVTGNADWEGRAKLVAARYVDAPGGAAEIALLADNPPGRRVKRVFRQRRPKKSK